MALNGLLDIELSVPNPTEMFDFWERRGLLRTDDGVLGTADRPVQITFKEDSYRHLSRMHLSCEAERDLADIAGRLEGLGVASTIENTTLTCVDPVLGHQVVIEVGSPQPLTPPELQPWNFVGSAARANSRAATWEHTAPAVPRRLGHVVLGSDRIPESTAFYFDGLGFKISDQVKHGKATFGRVEQDHHNLLLLPAKTGYLNHYAVEVDNVDAVGRAGMSVLEERADAGILGVGRHFLGSNVYWYLRDPSGGMFEFFCDMDQIVDDEAWARDTARHDWGGVDGPYPVSVWGPPSVPEFIAPPDIDDLAAAREARGLH